MANHVFRFPLRRSACTERSSLNDLLGYHLNELLRLIIPLSGGTAVKIDGYQTLNDRSAIHHLPYETPNSSDDGNDIKNLCEPRIEYVQNLIASLLEFIEFEADGQVVNVDGFRLKRPSPWLVPAGGASDILAAAASRCNLQCRFCYNKGTAAALRSRPRNPDDEYEEILSRIEHYVPHGRLSVLPGAASPGEFFAHPRSVDILRAVRTKTAEPLRIATNGSLLTPETIVTLREFAPLFLDVSLNSASPSRRTWLMKDNNPHIAIESLGRLAEARIPFSVVIVPWPFPSTDEMFKDLHETVVFADSNQSAFIQVSLPGYSRFFSEETLFDHDEIWNSLKSEILRLRNFIETPLIMRPGIFEEYKDPDRANDPVAIGAVKNSPLSSAGLQRGDKIVKVNGLRVKSRSQARSLLTMLHQSSLGESSITVERRRQITEMKIVHSDYSYPYSRESITHLGAIFPSSGIPLDWIERLHGTIAVHRARNVLLLSSYLVEPSIKKFIARSTMPPGVDIRVRVPDNRFWGGNIFMGDLMVVQDFIDAVNQFIETEAERPDLVVIPSSPFHLSGWGRDLTGRPYLEIENRTGIPVALVDCSPLFD